MAYLSKAAVKRQILFFSSLYEQLAIKDSQVPWVIGYI